MIPEIPVLFENDDLLVVDKPAGLASIPERDRQKDSVLTLLSAKAPQKLYVVHRLDKDASGVLVFTKNATTHKFLNDQFSTRAVQKTYVALVHGVLREEEGCIDKPIRLFGSGRMGVDTKNGKPCTTLFKVEKRFGKFTHVKIHPVTGRRHQIRVHFYSIGHPVVGDLLYGDRALQKTFPRLMLHASEIEFGLPQGEKLRLASPLPESFHLV
ncbi:MAG: RluA family pseudouridine synthase [Elusimicrobia bacterium]|nr:RluA family pseudouridine synthase [Candidatus Obscuribacterium magneticum]